MSDSSDNEINPSSIETLGIKNPLGSLSPLGQSFISPKFIRPLGARSIVKSNNDLVGSSDCFIQNFSDSLVNSDRHSIASSVRQDLPSSDSVNLQPQSDFQQVSQTSDRTQSEITLSQNTEPNRLQRIEEPRGFDRQNISSTSPPKIQNQQPPTIKNQIVQPKANSSSQKDEPAASNSKAIESIGDRITKADSVSPIEPPTIARAIDSRLESTNYQNTSSGSTAKLTSFIQQKSQTSSSEDLKSSYSPIDLPSRISENIDLVQEQSATSTTDNIDASSESVPQQTNTQQDAITANNSGSTASTSQYKNTRPSPKIQRESISPEVSLESSQQSKSSSSPKSASLNINNNLSPQVQQAVSFTPQALESISRDNSSSQRSTPANLSRTSAEINSDVNLNESALPKVEVQRQNLDVPPTQVENSESDKISQDSPSTAQRQTAEPSQNYSHNSTTTKDQNNSSNLLPTESASLESIEPKSNSPIVSPDSIQRQTKLSSQTAKNTFTSKSEPNDLSPQIQRKASSTETTPSQSLPLEARGNVAGVSPVEFTEQEAISSSDSPISNADTINSQIQRETEPNNSIPKESQIDNSSQDIDFTKTSNISTTLQRQEKVSPQTVVEKSESIDLPSQIQREIDSTEANQSQSPTSKVIAQNSPPVSNADTIDSQIDNTSQNTDFTKTSNIPTTLQRQEKVSPQTVVEKSELTDLPSQIQREIDSTETNQSQSPTSKVIAQNSPPVSNTDTIDSQIQRETEPNNSVPKESQIDNTSQDIDFTKTSNISTTLQRQEIDTSQPSAATSKSTPESIDSLSQIQREIDSTEANQSQSPTSKVIAQNSPPVSNADTIDSQIQREIEPNNSVPKESQIDNASQDIDFTKTSNISTTLQRQEIDTSQPSAATSKSTPESIDSLSQIQREIDSTEANQSQSPTSKVIAQNSPPVSNTDTIDSQIQRETEPNNSLPKESQIDNASQNTDFTKTSNIPSSLQRQAIDTSQPSTATSKSKEQEEIASDYSQISKADTVNSQIQRETEISNSVPNKFQTNNLSHNINSTENLNTSTSLQRQEIATTQASAETSKSKSESPDLPFQIQRETNLTEVNQSQSLTSEAIYSNNSVEPKPDITPSIQTRQQNPDETARNNSSDSQIQRETNLTENIQSKLSDPSTTFNNNSANSESNIQTSQPQTNANKVQREINSSESVNSSSDTNFSTNYTISLNTSLPAPETDSVKAVKDASSDSNDISPQIQRKTIDSKSVQHEISNNTIKQKIQREVNLPESPQSEAISSEHARSNTDNLVSSESKIVPVIQKQQDSSKIIPSDTIKSQIQRETDNSITAELPVSEDTSTLKLEPNSSSPQIQRETDSTIANHSQAIASSTDDLTSLDNNITPEIQTQQEITQETIRNNTSNTQILKDNLGLEIINPKLSSSKAIPSNTSSLNSSSNSTNPQIQAQELQSSKIIAQSRIQKETIPSDNSVTSKHNVIPSIQTQQDSDTAVRNNTENLQIQRETNSPKNIQSRLSDSQAIASNKTANLESDSVANIQREINNSVPIDPQAFDTNPGVNSTVKSDTSTLIQRQGKPADLVYEDTSEFVLKANKSSSQIQKKSGLPNTVASESNQQRITSEPNIFASSESNTVPPIQKQQQESNRTIQSHPDTRSIQREANSSETIQSKKDKSQAIANKDLTAPESELTPEIQTQQQALGETIKNNTFNSEISRDDFKSDVIQAKISSSASNSLNTDSPTSQNTTPQLQTNTSDAQIKKESNSKPASQTSSEAIFSDNAISLKSNFANNHVQRNTEISNSQTNKYQVSNTNSDLDVSNILDSSTSIQRQEKISFKASEPTVKSASQPNNLSSQIQRANTNSQNSKSEVSSQGIVENHSSDNSETNTVPQVKAQQQDVLKPTQININNSSKIASDSSPYKEVNLTPIQAKQENSSETIPNTPPNPQIQRETDSPDSSAKNLSRAFEPQAIAENYSSVNSEANPVPQVQAKQRDLPKVNQENTSVTPTQINIDNLSAVSPASSTISTSSPTSSPIQRQTDNLQLSGEIGKSTISEPTVTELLQRKETDNTSTGIENLGVIKPLNRHGNKSSKMSSLISRQENSFDSSKNKRNNFFTSFDNSQNSQYLQRQTQSESAEVTNSWSSISELMAQTERPQGQVQAKSDDRIKTQPTEHEFKSSKTKRSENWTVQKSAFLPPGVWQTKDGASSLSFMGQPQDISTKARQNIDARTKLKEAASNLSGKKLPPIKSHEIQGDGIENIAQVTVQTSTDETETNSEEKNDTQHAQSIDILAREVYGLLRQQLEVERERHGSSYRRFG